MVGAGEGWRGERKLSPQMTTGSLTLVGHQNVTETAQPYSPVNSTQHDSNVSSPGVYHAARAPFGHAVQFRARIYSTNLDYEYVSV